MIIQSKNNQIKLFACFIFIPKTGFSPSSRPRPITPPLHQLVTAEWNGNEATHKAPTWLYSVHFHNAIQSRLSFQYKHPPRATSNLHTQEFVSTISSIIRDFNPQTIKDIAKLLYNSWLWVISLKQIGWKQLLESLKDNTSRDENNQIFRKLFRWPRGSALNTHPVNKCPIRTAIYFSDVRRPHLR